MKEESETEVTVTSKTRTSRKSKEIKKGRKSDLPEEVFPEEAHDFVAICRAECGRGVFTRAVRQFHLQLAQDKFILSIHWASEAPAEVEICEHEEFLFVILVPLALALSFFPLDVLPTSRHIFYKIRRST